MKEMIFGYVTSRAYPFLHFAPSGLLLVLEQREPRAPFEESVKNRLDLSLCLLNLS